MLTTITFILSNGRKIECYYSKPNFLIKSYLFFKSIPSGSRWLTVHPHGKSEKGVHVLVQESKKGSGVYRVIGGAGGKLNYLKLRGVKSEKEYRREAATRQKTKREEKAQQRKADKEAGTYEGKQAAKKTVDDKVNLKGSEVINQVAEAMGWNDAKFPEHLYRDVSESAYKKALKQHHDKQLKRALDAIELQKKQLLIDADARGEALGELALNSDKELSVQDLDPVRISSGLGYSIDYTGDETSIKEESQDVKERENPDYTAKEKKVDSITEELKAIQEPLPEKAKLIEAKKAIALIKAEKSYKLLKQKAVKAKQDIDKGEEKAFVLEVSDAEVDKKTAQDLENDLVTIKTRAFLSEVGVIEGQKNSLGRHLGVGAYNSINSVSLVAGGAGLLDRNVVDVLGAEGATKVLARRLQNDLTEEEYRDITQAVENFHKDHYLKTQEEALTQAKEWQEIAKGIEIEAVSNGDDLSKMQELNAKRRDAVENVNRILGTALGEMETNAALVVALEQGAKDQVEVSLGNISVTDAIKRARAIGLDRGDYEINSVGSNRFLTVRDKGMDKLTRPVDRESITAINNSLSIINGEKDEDNWLPQGISNRPDLAMDVQPGIAHSMAEPFKASDNIHQSIKDYIGGRMADGDTPDTIYQDLNSFDIASKTSDTQSYYKALDEVVNRKDKDGNSIRPEALRGQFEQHAEDFVKDKYGESLHPIHKQSFEVNQKSVDSLHRALMSNPDGVLAYKSVGDLTRKEQNSLRDYFYKNIAKDERSTELNQQLTDHKTKEPEKEVEDLFGMGTNPMWTEWRNRGNELSEQLNKAKLDWPKFVQSMGSHENAYQTIQDAVKSGVNKEFHETYNKLNPENPLKLGRSQVSHNLNYLDAVDSDAREKRSSEHKALIDKLRDRNQGRYASGSVSEKIESAKEQEAAMLQSQVSLFSDDGLDSKELEKDERHTLGRTAEAQIASMMANVGQNVKPGRQTRIWQASMNGKYINQQRSLRLLEQNKKLVLAMGTGSGKSLIGLGAFADLHSKGKARKGLFVVPSIVQGQFQGEALRYMEPGRFKWHIEPGASRAERIKAYQDPETHFSVVTHQALRDDLIYLAAQQAGGSEGEIKTKINSMDSKGRKEWMKGVMENAGMDHNFLNFDEAQALLNRSGKENSLMANVLDAVGHNSEYYISASVSGDMSILISTNGLIERVSMECLADRFALAVGEIRSGLEGIRVRCFDWKSMSMIWSSVTAIHKFDATKKRCFEIIGDYKKRIVVTEDHSCYVWRDGKKLLLKGMDVKNSDQLIIETLIAQESSIIKSIELLDYMQDTKSIVYGNFPEITGLTGQERYRYKNNGKHGCYLPINIFFEKGFNRSLVTKISSIRCDSWSDPVVDIENIAYLVGYYIGNGCMDANSIQLVVPTKKVSAVIFELESIKGMRIKINKRKKKDAEAWSIRVQCYPLAMLFSSWFDGKTAHTKRVPTQIFNSSMITKQEVLRGYEDSDGHRNKHGRVTYTSCSRDLLDDMGVLLGFVGITYSIYKKNKQTKLRGNRFDNAGDAYTLSYASSANDREASRLLLVEKIRAELLTGKYHRDIAHIFGVSKQFVDAISTGNECKGYGKGRRLIRLSKSAALIKIRSIREVSEEYVYDISVDGTANFIANGILTHNSADPVKNDPSEIYSIFHKMDPERYNDKDRFMRRYSVNTASSKEELQREMARYFYPGKIESGAKRSKKELHVPLSNEQKTELGALDKTVANIRLARISGKTDVTGVKKLMPQAFEGIPEARHEAVAKELQQNIAITHNTAINNILNSHPKSGKIDAISEHAKNGKPGVVFAHSLKAVKHIADRLKSEGHRVITMTGKDSSIEKSRKKLAFRPESGEPEGDIFVTSDAGAVGANLQRGQWLIQYDTPQTAMVHAQRNGRIDRLGQKNNIELIDLIHDHPFETRNRNRLSKKYGLRELLTSPLEGIDDTGLAYYLKKARVNHDIS